MCLHLWGVPFPKYKYKFHKPLSLENTKNSRCRSFKKLMRFKWFWNTKSKVIKRPLIYYKPGVSGIILHDLMSKNSKQKHTQGRSDLCEYSWSIQKQYYICKALSRYFFYPSAGYFMNESDFKCNRAQRGV
jgi:hypothetical protein